MSPTKKKYGGRYALLERVGSGGMAEVYRARDDLLGREVAVKVLNERFARDRQFVQRFRREAQSAANLNHPNIVSLYDFGADGDAHYIVMELVDGRSLDDIVHSDGPLLPERAAEIASEVAAALEKAHQTGLVHRDVKPSNILLTRSGQTKVADFGIARAISGTEGEKTMTQTGMVIGTASYLSPEQAQGNPLDARSDVYSLGCVLYEMLTGRAPFTGDTPLAIAYKHVREAPMRPSSVHPNVPAALDAVTMKALAKNPDNRYSSAAEMREDLQRFLHGHRVVATPVMGEETSVIGRAEGTQVIRDPSLDEPRSRAGAYLLATFAILAVFGVLAWLFATGVLGGRDVQVPDVIGEDVDAARDIIEEAGLDWEIVRQPSEKPDDEVVKQNPKGGDTAREGDSVLLTVSSGPKRVPVPDVVGLPLEEAKADLRRVGLKVGTVTEEANDDVREGRVIRQVPSAEVIAFAGDSVDLVVSSGREVIVPHVIGLQEDEAIAQLESAGLEASVITAASDAPEGEVIAQDPLPGARVKEGDVVTITVSEGPEERPMPDVTGQDADDAQARLEDDYGLIVTQQDAACPTEPPGFVCDQDPPPDTPVAPGDGATLFVQVGDARVDPGSLFALLWGWLAGGFGLLA